MTTDVKATGLLSLNPVILGSFGTGMMVEHLKHGGTSHSSSDLLKICVKMGASWSAQVLSQAGDTLSRSWCFPSFVLSEDLVHVIFTYFQCRCGGEGDCWRC